MSFVQGKAVRGLGVQCLRSSERSSRGIWGRSEVCGALAEQHGNSTPGSEWGFPERPAGPVSQVRRAGYSRGGGL